MDPIELRASVDLAPAPESARNARRFIKDICDAARLGEDDCATAALLTSELVTNAIRYGGVAQYWKPRRPVRYCASRCMTRTRNLPEVEDNSDVTTEGGRGLVLVSVLASRWGVALAPGGGKTVWFELDLDRN